MKKLNQMLSEVKGEHAHKEAIGMGLKYKGFGFWADPATGETKFKTQDDQLVPVVPEQESELYKGGAGEEGGMDQGGMPGQGGMMGPGGMLQMPGQDPNQQQELGANILGAPEPGEEQVPSSQEWKAGPDGDTCVGDDSQPAGEIPKDAYVGKTNYAKWEAGPDGDNMTNVDLEARLNEAVSSWGSPMASAWTDKSTKNGSTHDNVMSDLIAKFKPDSVAGLSSRFDSEGNPRTPKAPKPLKGTGKGTLMNRLRGYEEIPIDDKHSKEFEAAAEFESLPDDQKEAEAARIERHGRTRAAGPNPNDQRDYVRKEIQKFPSRKKDFEKVKEMNKTLRGSGLLQDPDYDMSVDEDGYLGEGMFGSVSMSKDGKNVIKEGEIGPEELKALYALRDLPGTPNLVNAEFSGPFMDQSAEENNPFGGQTRKPGQSKYFGQSDLDPEYGELHKEFPSAKGKFAMSQAAGEEFADVMDELEPDEIQRAQRQLYDLRRQIHEKGISHNDMHGGNIYWDQDTQGMSLLDFGLAQDDPMSALMEAFGGHSEEDYQIWDDFRKGNLPQEAQERFDANRNGIRDRLFEQFRDRIDDPEDKNMDHNTIRKLLSGGIRQHKGDLQELADRFGWLGDEDEQGKRDYSDEGRESILGLVKNLYEGMNEDEVWAGDPIERSALHHRGLGLENEDDWTTMSDYDSDVMGTETARLDKQNQTDFRYPGAKNERDVRRARAFKNKLPHKLTDPDELNRTPPEPVAKILSARDKNIDTEGDPRTTPSDRMRKFQASLLARAQRMAKAAEAARDHDD